MLHTYPPNEFDVVIKNLKESYNDRAFIRKAVKIFKENMDSLKDETEKKRII